jgi:AcrR family transcriptional regulator
MPLGKQSANWHYRYTFNMPAGLRERNKLRRHEQITEAALRLFAERGFDGTTIDEIAAAADVSRRTFFRYFARKEDVILDWKRRTAAELSAALDARPADEAPLEAVHRALATVAAGYGEQPELTLGLMRVFESGPDLRAGADYPAWDAVLTDGIARRVGVDPLRDQMPRLVVTVGFAVFSATVQSWAESGGRGDLLAQLDEGFAALRGVVLDASG